MTSCLLLDPSASPAPSLADDLERCGIHVLGAVQRGKLVQEAVRLVPDVVVACAAVVDDATLEALSRLQATAPCPVVLFTGDPDVDRMTRALDCGVHAYVVNGFAPARLRALVHLAQARFAHERRLRSELAELSSRFEERKVVDRAKGILMRARQLSEDEAFRVLRTASMRSNQRVGQVSQQLIASAGLAEAVNRAGQCRMLSQRIVKLHALRVASVDDALRPLLQASCARVDENLATLSRGVSRATYGDLIEGVAAPWAALRDALAAPPELARLAEVDAAAERMLLQAERLAGVLQAASAHAPLQVINVCGRQRMLSQRVATQALLSVLLRGEAAATASARADQATEEFGDALGYLCAVPLTTPEIRASLDDAGRLGAAMVQARARVGARDGQRALGEASEELLALFEDLTERYERSMQVLMG